MHHENIVGDQFSDILNNQPSKRQKISGISPFFFEIQDEVRGKPKIAIPLGETPFRKEDVLAGSEISRQAGRGHIDSQPSARSAPRQALLSSPSRPSQSSVTASLAHFERKHMSSFDSEILFNSTQHVHCFWSAHGTHCKDRCNCHCCVVRTANSGQRWRLS